MQWDDLRLMVLIQPDDSIRLVTSKVLIWDAEGMILPATCTKVLWRSFAIGNSADYVSIPRLVEENADLLRSRYLAWIFELGETPVKGRRLIDCLEIRAGFSYWWMTLLAEKCNFAKSPQIDDAIRLLAFFDWATGRALEKITLASDNKSLSECLSSWCKKSGVAFEWQRLPKRVVPLSWVRRAYALLPAPTQALTWLLRYLIERWPLRGVGLEGWRRTTGSMTFVSYLFNLGPEAAKLGRHESRYWGPLPELLKREGYETNWLHFYVKDTHVPRAKNAATVIRGFNRTARHGEIHVTLDTFLNQRVILRTLKDWVRLLGMKWSIKEVLSPTVGLHGDLWPLFVEDWQESMSGRTAIANLLQYNLFECALKYLPKQRVGVYLQENQGWEFGFVSAWKAAGHGRLVGCPHSTVRFWDLRYFFDPRTYHRVGKNFLPLPDQVAVNGPAATSAYVLGGYSVDDLVQVEALRYLYLESVKMLPTQSDTGAVQGLRLLVLGDYLPSNTLLQMSLLHRAAASLPTGTMIAVKPHPACPILPEDYPDLQITLVVAQVADLLAKCDVAYASAVTSAAVDAYCAGVPVISVLDPTKLNLSPLRSVLGVHFVSTPDELKDAIVLLASASVDQTKKDLFFFVDTSLQRWQRLLLQS